MLWQYPADNWCSDNKSRDYSWATHLEFEARGEVGGEQISIGVGYLPQCDSTQNASITTTLEQETQSYTIPLAQYDLSQIVSGLAIELNEIQNQSFLESNTCIRVYIQNPRFITINP